MFDCLETFVPVPSTQTQHDHVFKTANCAYQLYPVIALYSKPGIFLLMQVFVGILCGAMFNGWAGDFGYLCAAEKIDISNRHSTNCYHDHHQTARAITLQLFSVRLPNSRTV